MRGGGAAAKRFDFLMGVLDWRYFGIRRGEGEELAILIRTWFFWGGWGGWEVSFFFEKGKSLDKLARLTIAEQK